MIPLTGLDLEIFQRRLDAIRNTIARGEVSDDLLDWIQILIDEVRRLRKAGEAP